LVRQGETALLRDQTRVGSLIKKTAALLLATSLVGGSAHGEEVDSGDFGPRKRLALNAIGIGGAVTAIGGVFYFVGRSGAALHVNPDGTLKPTGLLDEAYAAVRVQRVAAIIAGVGVVTVVTGTLLLLLGRKRTISVLPMLSPWVQGLAISGTL